MLDFSAFTQPFMLHTWISGTMVAVISSFIGFFIVIRGSAFVGHALPEAGFAGGAGAVLLHADPFYGLVMFTVGGAFLMGTLGKKEHNDVITALTLITGLGIGALFLGLSNQYASGAYALLFGQIVGVSSGQIAGTAIVGLICILGLAVLYRPLLLMTISKEVAEARGIPVKILEICLLLIVALASAVIVPMVGALLCFSLLIVPNAASVHLTRHPAATLRLSLVFSLVDIWAAILLAYTTGWPIGFFVCIIGAIFYCFARMSQHIFKKRVHLMETHQKEKNTLENFHV
ncbi:metal ABC transporter permease [Sporolactobacillus pectinivorans]|uniref:metal ABC transporter permease n=1 Tax=Sporolactobacillus pectinivorans TaxID=1591408 RepID=UPI0012FDED03|nr:metal ABC transporter permease [Sporolactobacillus pectinivorans]